MKKTILVLLTFMSAAGVRAQKPPDPDKSKKVPSDFPIYLYDSRLDAAGQSVLQAAGDIAAGQIFDTQLANLDAVAKFATDRVFSSGRRAALGKLEAARTWEVLYSTVDSTEKAALQPAPDGDLAKEIGKLKETVNAADTKDKAAADALKGFPDLLEEAGKSQRVIQFGKFLQGEGVAVTATDLRVVGKVQEAIANLGTILDQLTSLKKGASSRTAAEQMKVDLAKAEIDHLNALIQIEEKRLDGQKDVRSLIEAIRKTLSLEKNGQYTLKFKDIEDKDLPPRTMAGSERIEDTLRDLLGQRDQLEAVVYLLENFAALAARADTPTRLAQLRSAIEERRFAIRRDAILASEYEQVLLTGAQRIAQYYKGGIKPETLAQLANALATAGLIPAVAFK